MEIGIDASRVAVANPTGTERYSTQVIRHMLDEAPEQRFVLYFNHLPAAGVLDRTPNAHWRSLPATRLWTHGRLSLELLLHPPRVLFVPAHVIPLLHPRGSVVTVHDLGYEFFPSAHSARRRLELAFTTRWSCAAARRIIVPSEATRHDLERLYGVSPEKVRVIPHGVDEDLAPVDDPVRLAEVCQRYGLESDYLLYLGTLQPRKNVGRLAEAFLRARARSGRALTLALAGQPGWLLGPTELRLDELEARGLVRRLGYVERKDLAPLMSGALSFVFPSLYEGFGIPLLEAMACGAPVLASRSSSLPEVVGEAGLLVDPLDTESIAAGLERLVRDAALRQDLRRRGLERVRAFSWQRCARATLDVLQEAAVL